MTNQFMLIVALIVCSLGGWYVVLSKYLELKAMLNERESKSKPKAAPAFMRKEPTLDTVVESTYNPARQFDNSFDLSNHMPGFGPPPSPNVQFEIPAETLAAMRQFNTPPKERAPEPKNVPKQEHATATFDKRQVCNWACILHISGLMFVTGVPFLNIILPTFIWLWIKEDHPYLVKQGREVINFQITLTVLMFICLFLGTFFVWLLPNAAQTLFAWTKTLRIVFSTGFNFPFNIFTVVPFFWGCVMVVRGSVAAYHGVTFRYPLAQPFLFSAKSSNEVTPQTI